MSCHLKLTDLVLRPDGPNIPVGTAEGTVVSTIVGKETISGYSNSPHTTTGLSVKVWSQ